MKSIKTLLIFLVALTSIIPALSFAEVRKAYYPNGELKIEANYKNGKLEGIGKRYYESGRLQGNGNYKNDKVEGIFILYYENGQLEQEGNYKNGKEEGIFKTYYKSGTLRGEANYKNGKLEGIYKGYYEGGGIAFIDTFKNGQKINRKKYDENEKLVSVMTEQFVINALPTSVVSSNSQSTKREALNASKQSKYRLLITKNNGRYYWASRENKELSYTISGEYHIFIEINGAGYITVFDQKSLPKFMREEGTSFIYKEHVRAFMSNITYWGKASAFNP